MKKNRVFAFLLVLVLAAGAFAPAASAADAPELTANAALLVDITYGEDVLYEQNVHTKLYPAGLTCVMTGLLAVEAVERGELSLDQEITVTKTAIQDVPWYADHVELKAGETMSLGDLLRCALISSANDAANMVAEAVAGSVGDFVQRMNDRAAELGCENTHFVNTHGLHDENQYTTAWDMYLICRKAMEYAAFREIVGTPKYTVPATNLHASRELYNTNGLVSEWKIQGYFYKYATGIKTGFIDEAGLCLAAAATKDDRSLICIVLGCRRASGATGSSGYTQFTEAKALLEWGFNSYSRRTVLSTTKLLGDMPVTLSRTQFVAAQPAGSLEATLSTDIPDSEFQYNVHWNAESVEAPVQKGQVLGSVTVSCGGVNYGTVDLVAVADVERSDFLYYLDRAGKFLSQTWVKVLLVTLALLVLVLVLWAVFFRKRTRKRYTSSRPRPRNNYRSGGRNRR